MPNLIPILTTTNTNPIIVTTATPHGLTLNDCVTIAGVLGTTSANGTRHVSVTGSTTFTIPVAGNAGFLVGKGGSG